MIFTDVDGTLTTRGRVRGQTVLALEALQKAKVRVVLVTGRPAGYGECWARTLPVDGVIAENGGLYFVHRPDGRLRKVYAERPPERRANRAKVLGAVRQVLDLYPRARLSQDSAYAEVDLAVDYAEDVRLSRREARAIESRLRKRGLAAVRSSIHVNTWAGDFDKLQTVRRFLKREWRCELAGEPKALVYVGDSLNDEPMFARIPLSIGVRNVEAVLGEMSFWPAFVTDASEGRGFVEFTLELLRQKATVRR